MDRKIIDAYAADTSNMGLLPDGLGFGECEEPGCGDTMELNFATEREIITAIGYTITPTACPPMKACAAIVAGLAKGKAVMEAYLITAEQIAEKAGGLDKENMHCAAMAELTLKRAIVDYSKSKTADATNSSANVAGSN